MVSVRFEIPPYDYGAARRLTEALGVSHAVAQILVRRGYAEPAAARDFLEAEVRHPLDAFGGLRDAAARVLDHVKRGSRITVHGDYDADGVCSTAILVRVLRTLGATVDWYLPSRFEDGYGLNATTVDRLAARGTNLLITADCAITAVEEVAAARAAGLDVVVTDHHTPRADGVLPDAPIVHPRLGANPCPDLCAAGVAHKLAGALLEAAGLDRALADEDLDLVALATVADVVPLHDENRALVKAGIRVLARTRKPGLRALMKITRTDPGALDATAIGFRLAPRINAAGRLARADAAMELLLTTDAQRAEAVAAELDRHNAERKDVETRILFAAEAQVAQTPGAAAYVLCGEDWHPGVIGIVASRLAERHHRPVVLIALDGGAGTGSGRSIPAFDLLGGLNACARHLARHGGHRAAAGLTIERDQVDAFRDAFVDHAAAALTPEDLTPVERVDAIVPGGAVGLRLAEELANLGPFGHANPEPTLLIPCATLSDPRALGDSGRHVAFTLTAGGARAKAVRFGAGTRCPGEPGEPLDTAVRLEANVFNGTIEPRVLVRHAQPTAPAPIRLADPDVPLAEAVRRELARDVTVWPPECGGGGDREVVDVRGVGLAGLIADLVAGGEPVLVLAAHCGQRARALGARVGGFALASWSAFEEDPELAAPFVHVVALDPPPHAHVRAGFDAAPGRGWAHLAWGEPELHFAQRILHYEHALREPLAATYRALRAAGGAGGEACEALLRGEGPHPRTPAHCGRLVRVLSELGLVVLDPVGLGLRLVESPARTALERSAAYLASQRRLEDGLTYLTTSIRAAA